MVAMAGEKRRLASRLAKWRAWVQALFLLGWLGPMGLRLHTVCSPVFHCHSCALASFACPIGVLAQFSFLHAVPLVAIGTLLAVGAIFGSFVCGWACPFGFVQDLADKIPTPKFRLPNWAGYFRYVVLVGTVLIVPYLFGEDHPLFFCRLCPASALESVLPHTIQSAFSGQGVFWPSPVKITILSVFLVSILFTWRPWCAVFCPLGAIYTLCNRVSFFFVRFHPDRCIDCANCRSLCHDGGELSERVDSSRCVRCLECANCRPITVGSVLQRGEEAPEMLKLDAQETAEAR